MTLTAIAVSAATLAACGSASNASTTESAAGGTVIEIVAAENEYGSVASQVGGRFVDVASVESNPNTDPHTYEVSPRVAQQVAAAQLVIQNGVGYDDFMAKIESAAAGTGRTIIDVQRLLGLPDSTPNPHLWYDPKTMPAVANALAAGLGRLQPANAAYFKANAATFVKSLQPWLTAIANFKATYPGTPVATTEPVADYMLQAAGVDNMTPFSFQANVMNDVDPSPQAVSAQNGLFTDHKVTVFVYNQQVTDSLTEGFITVAKQAGVPIVGVYETMPTPGYTYQSWMLAEVNALREAVVDHTSTIKL
ncbi:MAG TPA: zinc ABC transporter substrate-binding protein [Pseudonocardiaceae bacterium]|nr:zinc ABC transporter substrate-binding protein [Pseudonocardiaceae bacterium]